MKLRSSLIASGLVLGTALVTRHVVSQDVGIAQEQEAPAWMKFTSPGEHHETLGRLAGTWDQEIKIWMAPGTPPEETTGKAVYEWIMGGRFLHGTYTSEMMGMPFEGGDLMGYDNFRKEFIAVWVDNHTTSFMLSKGQFDKAANKITMSGQSDDVMIGQRDKPFRSVTTFRGDNGCTFEMFTKGPDGKEFKMIEIKSTRMTTAGEKAEH